MKRPERSEADYYFPYIDQVGGADTVGTLRTVKSRYLV